MKYDNLSIHLWLKQNKIKNERGQPIDFSDHLFLFDIYNDLSPKQTCLKAAQIGFSTMAILKSLWLAKHKALDIIYCVDTETEALTNRGFKKHNEIKEDDLLLSLDLDGQAHWSSVSEIFEKEVETTMYRFEQRNFDACVTENHRWIVQNKSENPKHTITTTDKLLQQYSYIPKTVEKYPRIRKTYRDEYVQLLSWIFAEGYYFKQKNKNCYSIGIAQSDKNPVWQQEIQDCIEANGGRCKTYRMQSGCDLYRFAFDLGRKIKQEFPDKRPTTDFAYKLTQDQAKLFIDTFVKADGWIDTHGTQAITQKNKDTVDVLCMIAVIAGYAPSITPPGKNGCYTIRMTKYKTVHTGELRPTKKTERLTVWCPRTEHGTFYARRGGRCYWTGNTLPTANDVNDFVSGKVNRIIAQNPVLQDYVKDKDTIEQKRVGGNVIYYRATWTERAALMVTSDLNIHDEEDRSKQDTIQQYSSRLQHSDKKWEWHFSNPSVQGNGVSRYWDRSTQSHWFITCNHCFKRQYLSWPESIDTKRKIFICKKCGKELDQNGRGMGEWVKKYNDREYKGYWIPLFIAPWVRAEEIIKLYETKSKEFFSNFVLGLPYIGEGNTITPDVIYRNCTDIINSQERVVIGCDSGLIKHYVLGNKEGIFYYGKTETWDDIRQLLRTYKMSIAVIDALPDLTEPRKLKEEYPGRVYLCHYAKDRKTMQFVRWGEGKEAGNVVVDRNRTMQMLIDEFADMRIPLQGTQDDWSEYYSHWKTMYRVKEINKLGVPEMKWETSDGNDHWCHATLYYRTGMERRGTDEGALLNSSDPLDSIMESPMILPNDTVPNMSKPNYG